ncbi:hypothetical protein BVAVS116_0571 [Borreliella valaisiana VS116]|uniref:Uncharacterized protein n=1 Tax=Borreliella valaisiana VS116 TaxID=445987 RepID=D6RY47_BORVA|nr:hypothetical protein BVAVS116_0571 [Borreliella valaisiana VS116]
MDSIKIFFTIVSQILSYYYYNILFLNLKTIKTFDHLNFVFKLF